MPFFSLEDRIRELCLRFLGERETKPDPAIAASQPPQEGCCRRFVHPDGRLFWSYIWPNPPQDTLQIPNLNDVASAQVSRVPESDQPQTPAV